jgi:polar amino acid transport system substrate-binding protein
MNDLRKGQDAVQRRSAPLVFAAAAAVALTLSACAPTEETASIDEGYGDCVVTGVFGSIEIEPVTPGVLTVATNLPSPGWWQGTSPEDIDGGYEYCMAANIAHRAGLSKVVVDNISFDGLVAGATSDYDLALAQVSITDERKKVVEFSEPYYKSMMGVLVPADSDITEKNITEKQLGVAVATTANSFVADVLKPKTPVRVFDSTEVLIPSVQAKQIDAALQDTAILLGFSAQSDGKLIVIGQYDTGESYGAIYPKGSKNTKKIDEAIIEMKSDGTFAALTKDWLTPALGGNPDDIPEFTK